MKSEAEYKQLDLHYPYKAITAGGMIPERFSTEAEARDFFKAHKGTCHLSSYKDGEFKVLAYKFKKG